MKKAFKYKSVVTKSQREALNEFKRYLRRRFPEKSWRLILFGSRARGDYGPHSDTDVALILDGMTNEIRKEVIGEICDIELKQDTVISLIPFSKKDFDFLKSRERRIALDIENEGIML